VDAGAGTEVAAVGITGVVPLLPRTTVMKECSMDVLLQLSREQVERPFQKTPWLEHMPQALGKKILTNFQIHLWNLKVLSQAAHTHMAAFHPY
jgi:hypothetical protein